jgi:hypothetical protein
MVAAIDAICVQPEVRFWNLSISKWAMPLVNVFHVIRLVRFIKIGVVGDDYFFFLGEG